MDPVTTAILAGIATGAAASATEMGIVKAYAALKNLLGDKFGKDSDLVEAVGRLEQKPDSEGRQKMLQEEVEAVGADRDTDIREAVQALIEQIKAQPGGEQRIRNIQTAIGHHIAQAGPGGHAYVGTRSDKGSE